MPRRARLLRSHLSSNPRKRTDITETPEKGQPDDEPDETSRRFRPGADLHQICFFHVMYGIRKKKKYLRVQDLYNDVQLWIRALHRCSLEDQFNAIHSLFVDTNNGACLSLRLHGVHAMRC